jgi:hypothetical protein
MYFFYDKWDLQITVEWSWRHTKVRRLLSARLRIGVSELFLCSETCRRRNYEACLLNIPCNFRLITPNRISDYVKSEYDFVIVCSIDEIYLYQTSATGTIVGCPQSRFLTTRNKNNVEFWRVWSTGCNAVYFRDSPSFQGTYRLHLQNRRERQARNQH